MLSRIIVDPARDVNTDEIDGVAVRINGVMTILTADEARRVAVKLIETAAKSERREPEWP